MGSFSRNTLHQLVDTLPDGALSAVEHMLEFLQPRQIEKPGNLRAAQQRVNQILAAKNSEGDQLRTSGSRALSGHSGGWGSIDSGRHSRVHAEGAVGPNGYDIDIHRLDDHEVVIERDIRVSQDTRKLLCEVTVTGPDGKQAHCRMEFDIAGTTPVRKL